MKTNLNISDVRRSADELKQSIHASVVEFLKGVALQDYPCDINLGGRAENRVTELILSLDTESVEVVFGYIRHGERGLDLTKELGELTLDENIIILEAIENASKESASTDTECLFAVYRSKEESTLPFDAVEAFVLSGHPMAERIGRMLEADGYDLMDAEIEVEGREGRWDYYGKIVGVEAE